jgi:senataxin
LVGDPKQLPATLFSNNKDRTRYDVSLFQRMNATQMEHMLKLQYRMHQDICRFPSQRFYKGQLLNGETIVGRENDPRYDKFRQLCDQYGRSTFFNLTTSSEEPEGTSKKNVQEAAFTLKLINHLLQIPDISIGVIAPYKGHKLYLEE